MFVISKMSLILVIYLLYQPIQGLNTNSTIKESFVFGVMLALVISVIKIITYTNQTGAFLFSIGNEINQTLVAERVYLGFMAVLSFIFSVELYKKQTKFKKALHLFNVVFTFCFILLISARMALLSIILVVFYQLLFLKKYKLIVLYVFGFIFLISLAFKININLKNRFLFKDKNQSFTENVIKWEPRIAIWNCAAQIYLNDPDYNKIIGYGSFLKTKKALKNCYKVTIKDKLKRNWFIQSKFNTHNQFLDVLISTGYIVFLLFLGLFMESFSRNYKNRYLISLLLVLFLFGMVENFFHRQIGVYLFALILILSSTNISGCIKTKNGNE
ncbi:O-antigen ligase family protein [Algibacter sp.]|nr:O-antigen ligase family protein [Algibacter sp.]